MDPLRPPIVLTAATLLAGLALAAVAQFNAFSGDATQDFSWLPYVDNYDTCGDAGLPAMAPGGAVCGWDIERVLLHWDPELERLSVGVEFFGQGGDADGDGDEARTAPWLQANGGVDRPGLAGSEAICVAFDFDQDGVYDLIAGTGAGTDQHRVCRYEGDALHPALAFGEELPAHEGAFCYAPPAPDYEFSLEAFLQLDDLEPWGTPCFDFAVFAGSLEDDGIGEDWIAGTLAYDGARAAGWPLPAR